AFSARTATRFSSSSSRLRCEICSTCSGLSNRNRLRVPRATAVVSIEVDIPRAYHGDSCRSKSSNRQMRSIWCESPQRSPPIRRTFSSNLNNAVSRKPVIHLDTYFQRINYSGRTSPTLSTLQALHFHHALAIPFENFGPLLKQPVLLDHASLERKLIHDRR